MENAPPKGVATRILKPPVEAMVLAVKSPNLVDFPPMQIFWVLIHTLFQTGKCHIIYAVSL